MNQSVTVNRAINPFDTNRAVGMLLYAEYPSTALFIEEGQPIVREWIDGADDGSVDTYFYFKSNSNNLRLFIDGGISHRTFVKAAEGQLYYIEDKTIDDIVLSSSVYASDFPSEYYPGEVFISPEEVVDMNEISGAFRLYESRNTLDEQVKHIAQDTGNETYNLHVTGTGIGHGTIKTETLGRILVNFDSLFQEAALDQFVGKGSASKKQKDRYDQYISTQVYRNIAASYSILLKPKDRIFYQANSEGESDSSSLRIAQKLFGLINQSLTSGLMNDRVSDYSPRLINAYRTFIQNIKESGVDLDFSWYNPESRIMHSAALTHNKSNEIFSNIESLSSTKEVKLTKIGKFDHINCSTGYFGFLSGETINGYFDLPLREEMRQVNFVDTYEVNINKLTIFIPGKSEPRIEHTLTSYFKRKDSDRSLNERAEEPKMPPSSSNVKRIG
jgi:hypothetical protein